MTEPKRKGIIAYHPSKSEQANALLKKLKARLVDDYPGFQLWPVGDDTASVLHYFSQLEAGEHFEIIPLLLFPGQHFQNEVRALFRELQAHNESIDVRLAPCILERADFLDALLDTV